ncbi:hypothetical protein P8R33_13135 [Qipengyuania sp. XHP0211]|uniref:hypothetical protein n=1 Tax=Qipengyuania sp. XHP0211 TaxID=3038079 RepID=UPI00241D87C6|nr:hypothetical protein [Qipengyuania sp. XHP0211]MDG5752054.1 hypothetical protein [Qipengyuania sp. XHP0211]
MIRWAILLPFGFLAAGCSNADARDYFAHGILQEREATQFGLTRSEEGGSIVLRDTRQCGSGGEYRLRKGAAVPLGVTAPHAFHDRGTGELAMQIFARSRAAVAARNTVARDGSDGCEALDIAREGEHLFTHFALGFSDRFPGGLVVQLHGFDGARRSTARAEEAAAIVSNGTPSPDADTLDLADCLSHALAPRAVLVYPTETIELGAEDNAQGKALRDAGGARFAHIELSADLREAMLSDKTLLETFAACLEEAAA